MKSITKYDVMFLYEYLAAVAVNAYVMKMPFAIMLILVIIGLTFELITNSSWTYNSEFKKSFFIIENTDVSVAAAFSWAAILTLCMNLTYLLSQHWLPEMSPAIINIVMVGIVGNILETVCFKWGMFTYGNTWVTRMIFLPKPYTLYYVPIAVRVGYFLVFGVINAIVYAQLQQ